MERKESDNVGYQADNKTCQDVAKVVYNERSTPLYQENKHSRQ
jgi:hypothetical protein